MNIGSTTMRIRPVILAGGNGSRLWPYSRVKLPKQFLTLVGTKSMFQTTLDRVSHLEGMHKPIIVCSNEHQFLVLEQLRDAGVKDYTLILEPFRRDTAAAVAIASLVMAQTDADEVMLVLASDHDIACEKAFNQSVLVAMKEAKAEKLVTFGVSPTCAHTGYGYIQTTPLDAGQPQPSSEPVVKFVEKPDAPTAQTYLDQGNYYWNSGMFVFTPRTLIAELKRHAPEVLAACQKTLEKSTTQAASIITLNAAAFGACPSISLDYAVMEKTQNTVLVKLGTRWSDVGDWASLWSISQKSEQGNVEIGDVMLKNTENCYIRSSGKLVAAIGVENLVIVETDDAVLVAHQDSAQEIKDIVQRLEQDGRSESEHHRQVYRPWGHYNSIAQGDRFQVKRIVVKPGEKLSVQKHFHRAEHWVVVQGTARVRRGDETVLLSENESVYIRIGEIHSLENPGRIDLELIEIQTGSYLGEDDIVRYEDRYGRTPNAESSTGKAQKTAAAMEAEVS